MWSVECGQNVCKYRSQRQAGSPTPHSIGIFRFCLCLRNATMGKSVSELLVCNFQTDRGSGASSSER